MIKRMDNVLIVVEDLDRAKAFFAELGMEPEAEMTVEGPWVDQTLGLEDVRADIAMMRTPDGHGRVELSRFHNPPAVRAEPEDAPSNALGIRRIMFAVDDVDDVVERLRGHGAELVGEVAQYGDSYRLCYVRGPEGIVVGLAEELNTQGGTADHSRVRRIDGSEDARAAGELLDRFNREYELETPGPDFLARRVAELDGAGCATFLARDGAEDVGIAVLRFRPSLWEDADEAYLAELFVLPDRRKRGLGAELMAAVIGLARERGCRFIELGTDEHDHDAHRLYERSGFTNFANPDAPEAERERMLFFEREL